MSLYLPLLMVLGAALAVANGSNDVSKGIATLAGSGVTDLRHAVIWGTLWSGAGALMAAFAAQAMVATFGADLFGVRVHATAAAAIAILIGAAAWVGLSTWSGLPVATTHAIVGALAGVGAVAYGWSGVGWSALGEKVLVPLLASPFLAWGITRLLLRPWARTTPVNSGADCLCLDLASPDAVAAIAGGPALATAVADAIGPLPAVEVTLCQQPIAEGRRTFAISMDRLHWLSSGAVSFARGLNDAPKMVAMMLGVTAVFGDRADHSLAFFTCVAAGIVIGSWLAGRKVTQVLAYGVTPLSHREGLIANLVTAALVGPGAALGLPMSTTQVASGAIFGAGDGGSLNGKTVRDIMLAWAVTVPGAALLGISALFCLRWVGVR